MAGKTERCTLTDIARSVGISRAAAGKVLLGSGGNGIRVSTKTAQRVRRAAANLGYCPNRVAQQLRGKPSQLISLIMALDAPSVELDRLLQIERQGFELGFQISVSAIPPGKPIKQIQLVVDMMAGRGVDGFIFITPDENVYARRFPDMHGVPTVFNGVGTRFADRAVVSMDMEMGGRLSAEHVLRSGRRRIGTAYLGPNVFSKGRLRGIASALRNSGARSRKPVLLKPRPGLQELPEPIAEELVDRIVVRGKVDALIVENDYWAARLLNVMKQRGVRVPDDVALVGYNNLDLGGFTDPALTTIEEHNDRIAEGLLRLLQRQLTGERSGEQLLIAPELVVRESA